MPSTLESAARAFLAGRESLDSLVGRATQTPSGGADDQLIGVILGFGNTDMSTNEGLREALIAYFGSV